MCLHSQARIFILEEGPLSNIQAALRFNSVSLTLTVFETIESEAYWHVYLFKMLPRCIVSCLLMRKNFQTWRAFLGNTLSRTFSNNSLLNSLLLGMASCDETFCLEGIASRVVYPCETKDHSMFASGNIDFYIQYTLRLPTGWIFAYILTLPQAVCCGMLPLAGSSNGVSVSPSHMISWHRREFSFVSFLLLSYHIPQTKWIRFYTPKWHADIPSGLRALWTLPDDGSMARMYNLFIMLFFKESNIPHLYSISMRAPALRRFCDWWTRAWMERILDRICF